MKGQWIGKYSGTNTGQIIIDLDEMESWFEGYAYLMDDRPGLPISFASLRTRDKSMHSQMSVGVFPVDPQTGNVNDWASVAHKHPDVIFPNTADVTVDWQDDALNIGWMTNIATSGNARLPRSQADQASDYRASEMGWDDFKKYVSSFESRRFIFRGQEKPWRLRTSFHRTQRANLFRFMSEDIPTLYRVLSSRTRHIYDLRNPDQNGAFYHLVQHHGYPTPLLDWTYSPFVATFFSYRPVSATVAAQAADDRKVRIFVFDQREWRNDFPQLQNLRAYAPHFSILEFIAIDNDRMVPQQALSCATNVDDVESYIRLREKERGKDYLRVIDLPLKERSKAVVDLSVMSITAGSLFPGLDGACEEIRERHFAR